MIGMGLFGINSSVKAINLPNIWRLANKYGGSSKRVVNCISWRCSSGHRVHVATPPVFDSKVGFTDYEKERREFHLEVPEYFNFAEVIDEWAEKEKVGTSFVHIVRVNNNDDVMSHGVIAVSYTHLTLPTSDLV